MNDFTKTNLFSCPIYKIRIDPNSYDKEKIINDIKYNKSLKNTRNEPHQNIGSISSDIHNSYNDQDNVNFRIINYEILSSVYLEMVKEFFEKEIHTTKEYRFKFGVVNYSAITEGQWMPSHSHFEANITFACIHYLNFKTKEHVLTSFDNPAIFAPYIKLVQPELVDILDNMAPDNSYFWEYFEFPVEEDDMIIFPAALNHEVPPQGPTKEPRITISTNIKVYDEN
jgi:hypothetical protein